MPIKIHELDGSSREEEVTIISGRNIILKLVEKPEPKTLLKDPHVQELLKTPDLIYKETIDKIYRLIEIHKELDELLQQKNIFLLPENIYKYFFGNYKILPGKRQHFDSGESIDIITSIKKYEGKDVFYIYRYLKSFDNAFEVQFECFKEKADELNRESTEIEEFLKTKNQELDLLEPVAVPFCPHCKTTLFHNDEVRHRQIKGMIKCEHCENRVTIENAINIYVNMLHPNLFKALETGVWLEEYFASILRKFGWQQTWTSVYVLGASGVHHEIDVLGVKGGRFCLVECKTGRVSRKDVFNFWTKVFDIRPYISIFACLQEIAEPETRQFLQNNPSIILLENIKEKHENQLIQELGDSPIGK